MRHLTVLRIFVFVGVTLTNVILAVLLFLVLSPYVTHHLPKADMVNAQQAILQSVDADAVAIWGVNLEGNTRTMITYGVKSPSDAQLYTEFVEKTQHVKFTKSITPSTLKSLVLGESSCYYVHEQYLNIDVVKTFVAVYPKSVVCTVPLLHKSTDMIMAYASVVWKNDLTPDLRKSVTRQIESIMETYHVAF